jgi:hypothetical protein
MRITHPTSDLVVSLNVKHVERLLKGLADMGTRSSTTVEIYALDNLIRNDEWNKIN